MNLADAIETIFKTDGIDFIPVGKLGNRLSQETLKALGLHRRTSAGQLTEAIIPHLVPPLECHRKGRTAYIGYSIETIVLSRISRKPKISVKQLVGLKLPAPKETVIDLVNRFLADGTLVCAFNRYYTPALAIGTPREEPAPVRDTAPNDPGADREAFKAAYQSLDSGGRGFVPIHRLRERLSWSRDRFDGMLNTLRRTFEIQLHGGDPSQLDANALDGSFVDEKGRLRLSLTWRGS